jgi:AraC family transcriptional regulator
MELACDVQRDVPRGPRAPRWLEGVRERIAAAFADLPRLEVLATEAGVHPAHMARSFRRHFGRTIGEYARQRRLEFCSELLRGGSASLGEIAARAGFASQAHFARSFKLHTDTTPGEYRRLAARSCKAGARTSSR